MQFLSNQIKGFFPLKRIFFRVVGMPGTRWMYNQLYSRTIKSKVLKISRPKVISIEPYNVCNLRCIMCPYKEMSRKKILMSMDLFKKIVDDAKNCNIDSINLTLYNEPFIDPHIFERIAYVKNKDMMIFFFSNGTILNEENINRLLEMPPDRIAFSFDGATKDTYERIRIGANFNNVRENILKLIHRRNEMSLKHPVIHINFTIQKDNYRELRGFEDFWRDCADNVVFGIADNRDNEGVISHEIDIPRTEKIYPCRRLWDEMVIMSNGKATLCCIDMNGKIILGDMNKQSIEEVWNSEQFRNIRQLHLDGKGNYVSLCSGCTQLYRQSIYSWWF